LGGTNRRTPPIKRDASGSRNRSQDFSEFRSAGRNAKNKRPVRNSGGQPGKAPVAVMLLLSRLRDKSRWQRIGA
jgi:hypothetical protein